MTTRTIPTLETERLILRAYDEDTDFDRLAEFFASDRSKYFGGPIGRGDAWRMAAQNAGHWVLRGYGYWAVEEKFSGDFCGLVGLYNPEDWPEAELAWLLTADKEGKGIAFEAARRARTYTYGVLGWKTLTSCIEPENAPSIRLAARLGAWFDYEHLYSDGRSFHFYRHPAPEDCT